MANLFWETKRKRRKKRVSTVKKRVYKRKKKTIAKKSGTWLFQSILKKWFHWTINSYKEKKALEKKKKLLEQKKEQLRSTLQKRISKVKTRHTFNLIKSFFNR